MLAKDPSLIFRHWFAMKAPVNAVAALFEVIKTRKQRNCQLETNLFLESLIQLVRLACSSVLSSEAVAARKSFPKQERIEVGGKATLFAQCSFKKFVMRVYYVKKMTSQNNCGT